MSSATSSSARCCATSDLDARAEGGARGDQRWWTTRPTISCSSCTTRRCGARIPTATRSSARATRSARSASATCRRCTRARIIPAQIVVAASGNVEHDALLDVLERPAGRDVARGATADARVVRRRSCEPPTRRARRARQARRRTSSSAADACRARRSAPLRDVAVEHAARRRHELAALPARARGAGARVLGVHLPVVPRRRRDARRVRRHGAGDGARRRSTRSTTSWRSVAANGLPADELATGKQQLKGQITLSLESVSSRMYRAAWRRAVRRAVPHARRAAGADRRRSTRTTVATVSAGVFTIPSGQTVVSLGPEGRRS